MINLGLYLGFVLATAVLILIPGPNAALIVANSVARGTRFGLMTVAGTSSAVVVQLGLTALGLTAVLGALAVWFEWSAGSAWPTCCSWEFGSGGRPSSTDLSVPQQRSARMIAMRGFLVGLTNPKTCCSTARFFRNSLTPARPIGPQIGLLCATFLLIALVLDSGWALAAGRARRLLMARPRLRNRLSGGCLIGAGMGLALAHRDSAHPPGGASHRGPSTTPPPPSTDAADSTITPGRSRAAPLG